MENKLKKYYNIQIRPKILKESPYKYRNLYQIPQLKKIVINRGLGDASQNTKILETS